MLNCTYKKLEDIIFRQNIYYTLLCFHLNFSNKFGYHISILALTNMKMYAFGLDKYVSVLHSALTNMKMYCIKQNVYFFNKQDIYS